MMHGPTNIKLSMMFQLFIPYSEEGANKNTAVKMLQSIRDRKNYLRALLCTFYLIVTIYIPPDAEQFKRRVKSHLPFAGIIRSSPCSPR
jgi:hypothetical protein